jgi:two-component system sensor histidine kinase UhpB
LRELHDEAGQLLTSLWSACTWNTPDLADVKVKGIGCGISLPAFDEVGRLARGLHPTVLDDHGLGVALSRYVAEYTKTHNIAVDLTLHERDCDNLASAVQIGLYRIVQEALTNVARHSGAKAVSITFARVAAALDVAVVDDGCGLTQPWLSPRTAWAFRACERERQCWAERSVSHPGAVDRDSGANPTCHRDPQPSVRRSA